MKQSDQRATPEDAVTIAMEVIRWFMSPVKPVIPAYLNRDNFRITKPMACPMYRGYTVRLPTLRKFHHDFTLIPAEISGLRGLSALKNKRQHAPGSCPNTIFYLQTQNHDPLLGSEETYSLLFYHPESQSILDLEITVNDIDDEDCVTINGQIFVPLPPMRYVQTKRFIFVRQKEIELAAKSYVENALHTLASYNETEEKQFYLDLAKRIGITPVIHHKNHLEHG